MENSLPTRPRERETYSPLAEGWALLADRLFDGLNSRYPEAPEARRVADWLKRAFHKGEYIDIREYFSSETKFS